MVYMKLPEMLIALKNFNDKSFRMANVQVKFILNYHTEIRNSESGTFNLQHAFSYNQYTKSEGQKSSGSGEATGKEETVSVCGRRKKGN
jgi:hypothetical protein